MVVPVNGVLQVLAALIPIIASNIHFDPNTWQGKAEALALKIAADLQGSGALVAAHQFGAHPTHATVSLTSLPTDFSESGIRTWVESHPAPTSAPATTPAT